MSKSAKRDGVVGYLLLCTQGPLYTWRKEWRESSTPLHLYLNDPNTTWSIRFVFIFGGEFYFKLVLFIIYLRVRCPLS